MEENSQIITSLSIVSALVVMHYYFNIFWADTFFIKIYLFTHTC